MYREQLHTPDGVRDIYGDACVAKRYMENMLMECLQSFGYQPIETPTFEFFNTFSKEVGTTASKDLFKFFDRDGNTLVLRPDMTPPIARCAGKYFSDTALPKRFCYSGHTFVSHPSFRGRRHEFTQIGAEYIGGSSVYSDAELLSMVVHCLKAAGLSSFKISIGHANILPALMELAGILPQEQEPIRDLIYNKNYFSVEQEIAKRQMPDEIKGLFGILSGFYHSGEELAALSEQVAPYGALADAAARLVQLHGLLEYYGVADYVFYEPGMLSEYRYYTGIIFSGYTYGSGQPIATGGRYDHLPAYFGLSDAAIGFAITADALLEALEKSGVYLPAAQELSLYVYDDAHVKEAIETAQHTRSNGGRVELIHAADGMTKEDYERYASSKHIKKIIYMTGAV